MKRTTWIAASFAAVSLVSCAKAEIEQTDEEGIMRKLVFNTTTFSQEELTTRADGKNDGKNVREAKCSKLDFVMYDAEGDVFFSTEQDSTTTVNFGSISINEVPYGRYQIVAIAHNAKVHASISSSCFANFNGSVPETFCKYYVLSVDRETPASQSLELKRIVGMFSIKTTDTMPSDVQSFHLQTTGGYTSFNPQTGLGVADMTEEGKTEGSKTEEGKSTVRNIDFDNVTSRIGKTFDPFFYTFLASEESSISVTATAKDKGGKALFTYQFSNVPMKINHQTTYTGRFFSNGLSSSFTVDDSWGDNINKEF